jgi:hypothetical protein
MGKTSEEIQLRNEIKKLNGKWKVTHKSVFDGRRQTVALIKINEKYYEGYAQCSHHDKFDRKLGRVIALGRAMKQYREGKDVSLASIDNRWRFVEDRNDFI